MPINWDEIQKSLSPLKDYEDCCSRYRISYAYPFVAQTFNFSMPELADYSQKLLGGDARGRYTEYLSKLTLTFAGLHLAGVENVLHLTKRTGTRLKLEGFVEQSGLDPLGVISVLKYLVYWFFPGEKYLSGLLRPDASTSQALKALSILGVRTNLQLLQQGLTPMRRKALSEQSGLPAETILSLVNRADLSRLPWASKATISNIIGAGYPSLSQLATAEPEKLYADFFRYGKSIGKNLKLGNEIENSYRIASIVPKLVEGE